jgi:hypothetical protein
MLTRLKKAPKAVNSLKRHMNRLNRESFVEEYDDSHYSTIRSQEYDRLYQSRVKGDDLWKGRATKEGTEMFAVKNPKSSLYVSQT